jgi:hypothetical protein
MKFGEYLEGGNCNFCKITKQKQLVNKACDGWFFVFQLGLHLFIAITGPRRPRLNSAYLIDKESQTVAVVSCQNIKQLRPKKGSMQSHRV